MNPTVEKTAFNRKRNTKWRNRVSPTKSRGGRIPLVGLRQRRHKSLEGKGWSKKRMLICNGLDRGNFITSDRNTQQRKEHLKEE